MTALTALFEGGRRARRDLADGRTTDPLTGPVTTLASGAEPTFVEAVNGLGYPWWPVGGPFPHGDVDDKARVAHLLPIVRAEIREAAAALIADIEAVDGVEVVEDPDMTVPQIGEDPDLRPPAGHCGEAWTMGIGQDPLTWDGEKHEPHEWTGAAGDRVWCPGWPAQALDGQRPIVPPETRP